MNIQTITICFSLLMLCNCIGKIVVQSSQPHNKNCYTQGLFFINSTHLFQSCGLYGESYFHVMEYQSTPFEVRESFSTPIPWKNNIFLEGSVLFKNFIYLLTWRQNVVYKLNPNNFSVVQQLRWPKDGWGLTTNQTHMFTTDGSNKIYIVNENFTILQTKQIVDKYGIAQQNINELQYVDGFIFANIYLDTKIVKINVQSGKVVDEFSGNNVIQAENGLSSDEVINGIAYDKVANKFIITGKHWSKIHQVSFLFSTLTTIYLTFLAAIILMI